MKDYYKILDVEPSAAAEQIKSQYRMLLHAWHPDKFPAGELRAKAEERLKEINAAYEILGDPLKRAEYDRALRSKPAAQPSPDPQPPAGPFGVKYASLCDCCGLPAETRYIELYENIGMIFIRQSRAVKGELCRACIDYHFWYLTGRTMLLGWWGAISLFVAPLIILNNVLRFLFSRGMKKPLLQLVPGPPGFWVLATLGGFCALCAFSYSLFSPSPPQPASQPAPAAAPAQAALPPARVPTDTPRPPSCYRWDQVTPSMAGRTLCVYGVVYKKSSPAQIATLIQFSPQPGFYLFNRDYVYPDLKAGDCVAAESVVLVDPNNIPLMPVNDLYECQPWMR